MRDACEEFVTHLVILTQRVIVVALGGAQMNALTVAVLINTTPPTAVAAHGVIVFPVPPLLAWLVIGGLLAVACALLALVSERPPARRSRPARPRGWISMQPQPHRS